MTEDLSSAITRLINETPPLPVSTGNANAAVYADIAAELSPLDWNVTFPWATPLRDGFQDTVTAGSNVVLSGQNTGSQPLGMYAPPGSVVSVTMPQFTVDSGYKLQIGEKLDDLRKAKPADNWERVPYVI